MVQSNGQKAPMLHIELVLLWVKELSSSSLPLIHIAPFSILSQLLINVLLYLVLVPIFSILISAGKYLICTTL